MERRPEKVPRPCYEFNLNPHCTLCDYHALSQLPQPHISISHWLIPYRALYPRGDPYESSDPVFGVKNSLIVDLSTVTDPEMAKRYSVDEGTPLLTYDFVLVTEEESIKLRKEEAIKAIEKMGKSVEDFQGLPILDVD